MEWIEVKPMLQVAYTRETLPTAATLASRLDAETLHAWRARHGEVRETAGVRESLAALVLLRSMLSEGRLEYTETGKPCLVGVAAVCSMTHTSGGVFCALLTAESGVAPGSIGVDAETRGRFDAARRAALAKRWFTEAEQKLLAAAGGDEATFLRIWTGKEALVKRNGRGLAGIREADTTAVTERGLRLMTISRGSVVLTLATSGALPSEISFCEIQL